MNGSHLSKWGACATTALVLAAMTFFVARAEVTGDTVAPSPGETFRLDPLEQAQAEDAARAGGIDAMIALSYHYGMAAGDTETSYYWELKAADAGETTLRHDLPRELRLHDDPRVRAIARYLTERWQVRQQD